MCHAWADFAVAQFWIKRGVSHKGGSLITKGCLVEIRLCFSWRPLLAFA
jgi:hypothetical protein